MLIIFYSLDLQSRLRHLQKRNWLKLMVQAMMFRYRSTISAFPRHPELLALLIRWRVQLLLREPEIPPEAIVPIYHALRLLPLVPEHHRLLRLGTPTINRRRMVSFRSHRWQRPSVVNASLNATLLIDGYVQDLDANSPVGLFVLRLLKFDRQAGSGEGYNLTAVLYTVMTVLGGNTEARRVVGGIEFVLSIHPSPQMLSPGLGSLVHAILPACVLYFKRSSMVVFSTFWRFLVWGLLSPSTHRWLTAACVSLQYSMAN